MSSAKFTGTGIFSFLIEVKRLEPPWEYENPVSVRFISVNLRIKPSNLGSGEKYHFSSILTICP
jgi:hypothetical protein